jgi:hypothetical protein
MIRASSFKPCKWGRNNHLQTLWPTVVQRNQPISYLTQRLETEDGDFLDLAWSAFPVGNDSSPVLILFHGLEGSVESSYIKRMFKLARKEGWVAILMHFRGCSSESNRTLRSYHSGETNDADFVIRYLKKRLPHAPLFAVGFSLGGNMLLKYQGEQKENSLLKAAIAVSVPFELDSCSTRLDSGFSKVYRNYLLAQLKEKIKLKMSRPDYTSRLGLTTREIDRLKTFREFDEHITAPIHGFKGADDYYQQCSCRQFLKSISIRTLIIQAEDDPFIAKNAIPTAKDLPEGVVLELSEQGGHVGFISGGTPCQPHFWLEERISGYIRDRLANRID